MSTNAHPSSPAPVVEADEFLEFHLAKAQQALRQNDLLLVAGVGASGLAAYLLLFALLDQWLLPGGLSNSARWLGLLATVAGVMGWLWAAGWRPLSSRVNRLFAARELERAAPGLHGTLLTLEDLRQAERSIDAGVLKAIEKQAAVTLAKSNLRDATQHRGLLQVAMVLLGLVVALACYALLSPKGLANAALRMLPFLDVKVATQTRIVSVEPGHVTVANRARLEVRTRVEGQRPDEVFVVYSTADGQKIDERVLLTPLSEGASNYVGELTGEKGQGLQQTVRYHIAAGDARSDEYVASVLPPLQTRVEQVRATFPAYMQLDPVTTPGGNITGWVGAEVELNGTSSQPLRKGVIQYLKDDQQTPTGEEEPLTLVGDRQFKAKWTLKLRGEGSEAGTYARHYRLMATGSDGGAEPEPAVYSIQMQVDQGPEVRWIQPLADVEAPANAVLPLVVEARDPDFEVGYVTLYVERQGERLLAEQLSAGRKRQVQASYELALKTLGVQAGDQLTMRVEALDNQLPKPNRKFSPPIVVTIVKPISKDDVERKLAKDRKELEQKLDEAARQQPPQDQMAQNDRAPQEPPPAEENAGDDNQPPKEPENGQPGGEPKAPGDKANGEKASGGQGPQDGGQGANEPPRFKPDGSDDQDVLRMLRERFKDEPPPAAEPPPPPPESSGSSESSSGSKGEDEPSPSDGMKKDPGEPQAGEKQPPEEGTAPTPRNEKPAPNKATPRPPEGTNGAEPKPPAKGENALPQRGDKPEESSKDEPAGGAKAGENGDAPPATGDPEMTPAPDEGASPKGETAPKPADGETPEMRPKNGNGGEQPSNEGNAPEPGDGKPAAENGDQPPTEVGKKPAKPGDDGPMPQGEPMNGEPGPGKPEGAKPEMGKPEAGEPAAVEQAGPTADGPKPNGSDTKPMPGGKEEPAAEGESPPGKQGKPQPQEGEGAEAGDQGKQPPKKEPGQKGKPAPPQDKPADEAPEGNDAADARRPPVKKPGAPADTPKEPVPGGPENEAPQVPPKGAKPPKGGNGKEPPKGAGGPAEPMPKPDQPPAGEGGEPGEGKGEGEGNEKGDGDGKGKGEGKGEGKGQGEGKGEGQGQGEGSGKGEGQSKGPGKGKGSGEGQGPAAGKEPGRGKGGSGAATSGGGATEGNGGEGEGEGQGAGGGAGGPGVAGEAASEEFQRKAAELTLKQLQKKLDRGEVDAELLKELGWSEEQLRQFSERIGKLMANSPEDDSPAAQARRKQFEEMLKTLPLERNTTRRSGAGAAERELDQGAGRRTPVPLEYREQLEAFTRGLNKKKPAAK